MKPRATPLARTGRLKVRGRRRFKESADPAYLDWIHTLPCCVTGQRPVVAHHVRSRGAGGTDRQTVPLTDALHREGHQVGWRTFETRYGVDLTAIADGLAATYEEERCVR